MNNLVWVHTRKIRNRCQSINADSTKVLAPAPEAPCLFLMKKQWIKITNTIAEHIKNVLSSETEQNSVVGAVPLFYSRYTVLMAYTTITKILRDANVIAECSMISHYSKERIARWENYLTSKNSLKYK
jgi:hypothetical protein